MSGDLKPVVPDPSLTLTPTPYWLSVIEFSEPKFKGIFAIQLNNKVFLKKAYHEMNTRKHLELKS